MDAAVPFTALWLEAPMSLLFERVAKRRGDPSDATIDVVRAQAARELGMVDWRRVAVSDDLDDVVARVISILRYRHGGPVSNLSTGWSQLAFARSSPEL